MSDISQLRPVGPLAMIDRAIVLARSCGGSFWLRGWLAGWLFGATIVVVYYLERVEGVHTLRPALAALTVAGWCGRAVLLGGLSRQAALTLWPGMPLEATVGRTADIIRIALVVGVGLAFWALPLVLSLRASPWLAFALLPFLALRGCVAPAWLARAACAPETGGAGFRAAVAASRGRRGHGLVIEYLLLLAGMAIALNVFALVGFILTLLRSILGIDVALVEAFVSFSNDFALLVVVAGAFSLMEPVRAALSAAQMIDARVRAEGIDLRALVQRALRKGRAIACVLCSLSIASVASAQDSSDGGTVALEDPPVVLVPLPNGSGPDGVSPDKDLSAADPTGTGMPPKVADSTRVRYLEAQALSEGKGGRPEDATAQETARRILARPEYREFGEHRSASLFDFLDRWLDALREWLEDEEENRPLRERSSIQLPSATFFIVIAAIVFFAVALFAWLSHRRSRTQQPAASLDSASPGTATGERLAQASASAARGNYREGLRQLYVATLTALDRERVIEFDPAYTNGHYLRKMSAGERRDLFSALTRLFDRKWYGDEVTGEDEFRSAQGWAERICSMGQP